MARFFFLASLLFVEVRLEEGSVGWGRFDLVQGPRQKGSIRIERVGDGAGSYKYIMNGEGSMSSLGVKIFRIFFLLLLKGVPN